MNKMALFSLLFLVSCSTVRQKQPLEGSKQLSTQGEKPKSSEKTSQSDLGLLTSLKKKVAEARKGGKEKIKLLSGELFLKASDASFRSDYKTSILYFRTLLEMTPGDPYLSKRLGVELIKIGQSG